MANKKKSGSKKQSSKQTNKSKQGTTDLARAAASASTKKQGQNKKQGNVFQRLVSYVKGVRQEFSKVVWPTREELTTDTVVVFATVIFFAVAFWLIDTGFLAALKGILGITLS